MLRTHRDTYTRLCRALWSKPLSISSFSTKIPHPPPSASPATQPPLDDHLDENAVYELRTKMLKEWETKSGKTGYAAHQPTSHTILQFRDAFSYLKNGEKAEDQSVSVSG